MSAAYAAIAAAPPDAIKVRIIRYRVRRAVGQGASEWLGDALFGADDGGSDGPRPLRTAAVHWITAAGDTVVVDVPDGEGLGPDAVARLLVAARSRGLPCSVWTESDRHGGDSMQLTEKWFGEPDDDHVLATEPGVLDVCNTSDGVIITVDEWEPPRKMWLLFYPVMLFSFAWIYFLVIGALPEMMRRNWQRAFSGVGQRCVVALGAHALRFDVERSGRPAQQVKVDRSGLLAVGASLGFFAYTEHGALELPSDWATEQQEVRTAIRADIASVINQALAAT